MGKRSYRSKRKERIRKHNEKFRVTPSWITNMKSKKDERNSGELVKKFPDMETLFRQDDVFGNLVREWRANLISSRIKKSEKSTIRRLHTSEDNQKQFYRREKILEYCNKKGISKSKVEKWLDYRF